ncbi:PDZ domain-containing protein [Acidithiobacillus ferrooxidans]|uniref:PDZ domain-containing protein n=2 Tax=Acidithiobacillus TaxID=119977 RepID=UPI0021F8DDBD|nr:PDZ domain-containing protein [Acidithiobacillus ferrooxidans]
MRAVHAFERHQKVKFGWLGVEIQSVTPQMAQAMHLPEPVGALIAQVMPSSPAAKAGIKSGEVIVAYDHRPIYNVSTLPPLVGDTPPGRIVPIGILDHGKPRTLQVQVGEMPQKMLVAADQQSIDIRRLGVRVGTLGPKEQQKLGVDHGVLIQSVYPGPASFIGLRSGMAILSINQLRVTSPEQLAQLVKSLPANTPISMRIRNHHGSIFVVITLPTR